MNLLGKAALELLTSFWVLESAVALIKTRNARRLFADHQRRLDAGVKPHEPRRVALIIAVKGVSENFERFMEFALGQDYPDYQVLFVTESECDPAHAEIRRRLGEGTRARLIVAGKAQHTGQKVHNQLAAFKLLESTDRIVAFADGDLFGRKNWLTCLALPLNLSQADFTTGYRWFIPADQTLPNRIVSLNWRCRRTSMAASTTTPASASSRGRR